MENPIIELLEARKATRAFSTGSEISGGTVNELIEAIRLTPSCYNKQPWRYKFLLSDKEIRKATQFLSEGNKEWALRAPLIIVGYAKKENDCVIDDGRAYYQFDLGMSAMNLMLAATHRGLIARPMAGFDPDKVKELLHLEEDDEPLIVLAVGYPAKSESFLPERLQGLSEKPRVRKDASEITERL